jgi:hypothetical protein
MRQDSHQVFDPAREVTLPAKWRDRGAHLK